MRKQEAGSGRGGGAGKGRSGARLGLRRLRGHVAEGELDPGGAARLALAPHVEDGVLGAGGKEGQLQALPVA